MQAALLHASITLSVNDTTHTVAHTMTLAQLLAGLGLSAAHGVAVAINDVVVSRSYWEEQRLAECDQVLVIQATQGG